MRCPNCGSNNVDNRFWFGYNCDDCGYSLSCSEIKKQEKVREYENKKPHELHHKLQRKRKKEENKESPQKEDSVMRCPNCETNDITDAVEGCSYPIIVGCIVVSLFFLDGLMTWLFFSICIGLILLLLIARSQI